MPNKKNLVQNAYKRKYKSFKSYKPNLITARNALVLNFNDLNLGSYT